MTGGFGAFGAQEDPDERLRSRCCRYAQKHKLCCCLVAVWAVLAGLGIGTFAWAVLDSTKEPLYSAAITSVSGLDPPAAARDDLGRRSTATLDPAFNLTLRIASRSRNYGACLDAGAWLDVSYRGVRLAAAPAPPRLCAGRMAAAETAAPVVAWGAAVHVPGFAMDGLAEEMRRGDAAFDVTLTVPSVHDHRQGKLVRCMARRAGDVVVALGTPCVVNYVDTAVAVLQAAARSINYFVIEFISR
nr:unnamed protein product [Digitaria exilis]